MKALIQTVTSESSVNIFFSRCLYLVLSLGMSLLGASELLDVFFSFSSSSSSSSSLPFSSYKYTTHRTNEIAEKLKS